MSSVLSRIKRERPIETEPRLLEVGGENAQEVLTALSGETSSRVFEELHADPATPSELATRIDTSLQNVHYHLDKLRSVGLVDSAGMQYSEKGREMTVYAPANDPIIIVGSESSAGDLEDILKRWTGTLGILTLGSLLVQVIADYLATGVSPSVGPAWVSYGADGPQSILLWGVDPGVVVFVGGLVVVALRALRRRG